MDERKDIPPSLLGEALVATIRQAVRDEIRTTMEERAPMTQPLLTPEELAERLHVPISWVYEQSRQGKIPTVRLGRYIRFDLKDVVAAQKSRDTALPY